MNHPTPKKSGKILNVHSLVTFSKYLNAVSIHVCLYQSKNLVTYSNNTKHEKQTNSHDKHLDSENPFESLHLTEFDMKYLQSFGINVIFQSCLSVFWLLISFPLINFRKKCLFTYILLWLQLCLYFICFIHKMRFRLIFKAIAIALVQSILTCKFPFRTAAIFNNKIQWQ